MKTKAQKQEELKKGKELLSKSEVLIFTDLAKVSAEAGRKLRRELRDSDGNLFVIKKRLLALLLKEKNGDAGLKDFKLPVATVFSSASIDRVSGTVYKFFKGMNLEKEKILGGFDLKKNEIISKADIMAFGQLPPREVLLSQLVGQLAAPISSLLYVLNERGKKVATE